LVIGSLLFGHMVELAGIQQDEGRGDFHPQRSIALNWV
jgi:hypothetical protein